MVANIKTMKKRLIDRTQVRDGVKRGRGEETRNRVAGQLVVKYKEEECCWTHRLNKEDYRGHCTR